MLKFIFYLIIFYFIGYYYAEITNGTVFDNLVVFLICIFIFIFVIELVSSILKARKHNDTTDMNNQENETWGEILDGVKSEFKKSWHITYENRDITIVNHYNREELFIDEKLVSENKRKSWYSWIIPSHTLKGTLELDNKTCDVKVKLGGLLSLNCKVYVDKELIYKEKIKYSMLTGEMKDKD